MTAPSLRALLDSACTSDVVDASMFARVVFHGDRRLASLAGLPIAGMKPDTAVPASRDFLRDAVAVLEAAMTINSDESRVLQWFNRQPLEDFSMRKPVEIVADGQADALLKYVISLESGSTG